MKKLSQLLAIIVLSLFTISLLVVNYQDKKKLEVYSYYYENAEDLLGMLQDSCKWTSKVEHNGYWESKIEVDVICK